MTLIVHLCFRARQQVSARAVDRFENQVVSGADQGNRTVQFSRTACPLTNFLSNLGRKSRTRIFAHHPQRLMDLLFRHETQEGRLLQLDRKTFSKRPVEYCIASRIGEISENDGVLFCEVPCLPRPPEQSSRYSRGEHYNGRCDSDLPAANRCDRAHTRGGPSRCPIYPGNRGDKPIPAPRQCLDEPRIIRRIAKSLA